MANQNQYGHPLFLDGFQASSSAKRLNRIHFSKNVSDSCPYDEAWLQRLIMAHPSLLPVDQIEPGFADLVPVCIELPVGSGYLDNLLITPNGDIALIECKLWRNPEARREVVGQIIDYAKDMSMWSYGMLQDAINRTKPLRGSSTDGAQKLYDQVSPHAGIDETSFHDTVSRNLKRGRFLLLIVGDGIREGVESMTEFLQKHAGFHFTLAVVELALFELPSGGYIAQPRVLTKTTNIERGIVTVEEGRISIKPPTAISARGEQVPRRTTITQERYFEQLEKEVPGITPKLRDFIENLATQNVTPEFGIDSMILRWRPDDTRGWNLGTITTTGVVMTDYLGQQAQSAGLSERHKQYLRSIAGLVPGAYVKKTPKESAWYVAQDGKYINAEALLVDETRRDGWIRAIAEFQQSVETASQHD